ncbi:aldehyde dehydrogenase [Athelia psychrophila]|uniref:Aldehyde dehydrogenase n=1 Tax=Athelia psychrophila TaxID=1759441 RepID=A0A166J5N1_9AGAM|nr:aldehyde dehydrogenase [Fibularhizoctonia sp. CBS 109695]
MSEFQYTHLDEIPKIHEKLRLTFESGKTLPLHYRRAQLLALGRLVQDNADALLNAIYVDVGRQKLEANMPEISPIVAACVAAADSLETWMKPEKPPCQDALRSSWDITVHRAPKGIVINIVPWNYPVILALWPLVGAIAAGCTCVVKPSELSPTVSTLLADLFPKYLDTDAYAIVNGAVPETERLLEFKWDHIFFTGSARVGRIIAVAAAKQLTPVTLELGGKSPVFIDANNTDLEIAARRVLWGKIQNAGQANKQDALVAAFEKAYDAFWPHSKSSLDENSELGHIISAARGQSEGRRIALTIVKDVRPDDILMREEIFGPIMSIVPVDDVNEAIHVIRSLPSPLVIYLFSESAETKNLFLQRTRSGSLILNDTFSQLSVTEMPFGGCGDSGYGQYFGKYSFDTFTHLRSSSNVPLETDSFLKIRYPPYTEQAYEALTPGFRLKIPDI